jgi:hypothetical protein
MRQGGTAVEVREEARANPSCRGGAAAVAQTLNGGRGSDGAGGRYASEARAGAGAGEDLHTGGAPGAAPPRPQLHTGGGGGDSKIRKPFRMQMKSEGLSHFGAMCAPFIGDN